MKGVIVLASGKYLGRHFEFNSEQNRHFIGNYLRQRRKRLIEMSSNILPEHFTTPILTLQD